MTARLNAPSSRFLHFVRPFVSSITALPTSGFIFTFPLQLKATWNSQTNSAVRKLEVLAEVGYRDIKSRATIHVSWNLVQIYQTFSEKRSDQHRFNKRALK